MNLLDRIKNNEEVEFNDVISFIDEFYLFTPTAFKNGTAINEEGQNNGSCKIFSFASTEQLNEQQTLNCFGTYYRNDVLEAPNGTNHANIRHFIKNGWSGIDFDKSPLKKK